MRDERRYEGYFTAADSYDSYFERCVRFARALLVTEGLGELIRLAGIGHPGCRHVLEELRGELGPVLGIAEALT